MIFEREFRLIRSGMALTVLIILAACQSGGSAVSSHEGKVLTRLAAPIKSALKVDASTPSTKIAYAAEDEGKDLVWHAVKPVAANTNANADWALAHSGGEDLPEARIPEIGATPAALAKVSIQRRRVVGPVRTSYKEAAERRAKFEALIRKHAKEHGVPEDLALAVVEIESMYRPDALGRAGEVGLMQILPRTARYIGYEGSTEDLFHPDTNIRYGMKYLGKAHRLGGGTTCGTILKYNAGHSAKQMNAVTRDYCKRVTTILQRT
jgi:soluble lytic murein transglycosylase-like protein